MELIYLTGFLAMNSLFIVIVQKLYKNIQQIESSQNVL